MARKSRPFATKEVAAVFQSYPSDIRARLLRVRDLIFEVASATPGVDEIEETLKWSQPSYLTGRSGSGTTIRIDRVKSSDREYAVYVSCLTDLVSTFRELYPKLRYEGKKAIRFDATDTIETPTLRHCIALALTYHLRKRKAAD